MDDSILDSWIVMGDGADHAESIMYSLTPLYHFPPLPPRSLSFPPLFLLSSFNQEPRFRDHGLRAQFFVEDRHPKRTARGSLECRFARSAASIGPPSYPLRDFP